MSKEKKDGEIAGTVPVDEKTFPEQWVNRLFILSTENINPYVPPPMPTMFKVWTEGYRATGEHGEAAYHGECLAYSFIEACRKLIGDSSVYSERDGRAFLWGCEAFDNEADARKSFG